MKQKLLFYVPNDFNIDLTITNQLKKMHDYEITKIDPEIYQYKNIFERVYNLFGKIFLKKTLKKNWKATLQLQDIYKNEKYDLCLVFRPDLLHESVLIYLKENIPVRKVVYWDSFDKIPKLKDTMRFFNEFYSFEEEDCLQYNLKKISNFYIQKKSNLTPIYDAFFFGSKDARLPNIINLISYLRDKNWNAQALIVKKKTKSRSKKINIEGITITETSTTFSKIYQYSENTKIVIDIAHPNQKGLSMRPYEALGLQRKLITNNVEIKKYDFFNPNNIFIINNLDDLNIPDSFIETPYQEIPEDIYNKYHISTWLKNILD